MHRSCAVLALAAGFLFGNPAAADVQVELGANVDFGAYETYAWRDGTPARHDVAEQRIHRGVDQEMERAGLRRVDAKEADLWVVTHVLVDRHSLQQLDDREYWKFITGVRSADAFDLGAGTLVIDLIDSRQERIVLRGAAGETIRGDMDSNLKKIDKAIRKMFKRWPG